MKRIIGDGDVEAIGSVALFLFGAEVADQKTEFATITVGDAITAFSHLVGWPENDLRLRFAHLFKCVDSPSPNNGEG